MISLSLCVCVCVCVCECVYVCVCVCVCGKCDVWAYNHVHLRMEIPEFQDQLYIHW